jgi:hypothetical protein
MSAPHTELTPTAVTEPGMRGVVRVLGGAGTGKSSLLVRAATAHIAAGCDPESVLLLTGSARLNGKARAAITSALLSAGSRAVVREPLVRTVHSYAFAILRLAAQRNGDPPPRLITSAEQDGIIRERWPATWGTATCHQWRGLPSWAGAEHPRVHQRLRDLLAAAPNAAWILARNALTKLRPARMVAREASSRPTSGSCRCAPPSGWRRLQSPCPRWAPPNWSVPRSRRSQPTRTCWRPAQRVKLPSSARSTRPAGGSPGSACVGGTELTVIAGDASRAVLVIAAPTRRCCAATSRRSSHPVLRCAPVIAGAVTAVARRLPKTRHDVRVTANGQAR